MKKLSLVIVMVSVITVGVQAEGKRYEVESGIVNYKISTSGAVMGIKSEGKGTASLVFKDYGNIELSEEHSTSTLMGQTEKNDEMTKIENAKVYSVDFDKKTIFEMDNVALGISKNKNMTQMGKEMMQSMGGKKVGNGKVLGYDCEIWSLMGVKMWVYKGLTLKVESSIMGITNLKEATSAKFDIDVDDKNLTLPNFKVQTLSTMMQEAQEEATKEATGEEQQSKEETSTPKKVTTPKELTPCQKQWKAYFDCQDGGEKDLEGYKQALSCAKYQPNMAECPPAQVTMESVKDDFKDLPSGEEINKATKQLGEFMKNFGGMGQ